MYSLLDFVKVIRKTSSSVVSTLFGSWGLCGFGLIEGSLPTNQNKPLTKNLRKSLDERSLQRVSTGPQILLGRLMDMDTDGHQRTLYDHIEAKNPQLPFFLDHLQSTSSVIRFSFNGTFIRRLVRNAASGLPLCLGIDAPPLRGRGSGAGSLDPRVAKIRPSQHSGPLIHDGKESLCRWAPTGESSLVLRDFDALAVGLSRLGYPLAPTTSSSLLTAWQVKGGRYCSLDGEFAAQINLTDQAGRKSLLYVAALSDNLRQTEMGERTYADATLRLWKDDGRLFVQAIPSE